MLDFLEIGKALKYPSGYSFEVACPGCGGRMKYLWGESVSEMRVTGIPKNRFRCDHCQANYEVELKYTAVQ